MEIDRELNGIEISGNAIRGVNDTNIEADSNFPNNKEEINESGVGVVTEKGVDHVPNLSENPNFIRETLQPKVCEKNSGSVQSGQTSTRTWIRIMRKAQDLKDGGKGGIDHCTKQSFMDVDGCEVQKKKRLAPSNSKTN